MSHSQYSNTRAGVAGIPSPDTRFASFDYQIKDRVAVISLNRPEKRNCLIREFWHELPAALGKAEEDPEVRCVLIRAEGPIFTSGIDLSVLDQLEEIGEGLEASRKADYLRRTVLSLQETINALEECDLPVVAAIQGHCLGGGLDLVSAADIRLVEKQTVIQPLEVELGFVPDLGTVQRLGDSLPPAIVNDWLMTCRKLSGYDACNIGFASRLGEDPEHLYEITREVTEKITRMSPMAIRGIKETLRFTRRYGVEASLRYTAAWQSGVFPGADLKVSLESRESKVIPEYEGLCDYQNLLGARDKGI